MASIQYSELEENKQNESCVAKILKPSWATFLGVIFVAAVVGVGVAFGIVASRTAPPTAVPAPSVAPTTAPDAASVTLLSYVKENILMFRNDTLDPCDDFYQYACGAEINTYREQGKQLPISFATLDQELQIQLMSILRENFPLLTTFFDSCVDTAQLDRRTVQSVFPEALASLNQAQDLPSLLGAVGALQLNGLAHWTFLDAVVSPDPKTALENILDSTPTDFMTDGFSDYQFGNATKTIFVDWLGYNQSAATEAALQVMSLRFQINQVLFNWADQFQSEVDFFTKLQALEPLDRFELANMTGGQFDQYYNNRAPGLPASFTVLVFPEVLQGVWQAFQAVGVDTVRHYALASLFLSNTDVIQLLPAPLRTDLNFILYQIFDLPQRDQYCLGQVQNLFGDLLAHIWVVEDFTNSVDKYASILGLLDKILASVEQILTIVPWLDDATRAEALTKFQNIVKNVAYPQMWSNLNVPVTGDLLVDFQALSAWQEEQQQNLLYMPVNRTLQGQMRLGQATLDVNAFYDPQDNSINLLAALIAPPFFNPNWPLVLNLPSYGMVIGHEIFHGFDNNGRLFDGNGAFRNWWSAQSTTNFQQRAQCLVNQFNQFPLDDSNGDYENGQQTLGENIADHGGLHAAFQAYLNAYSADAQKVAPQPQLPAEAGLTLDQAFFLKYAQTWCADLSNAQKMRFTRDVHSEYRWRVNGPLSNFPAFAKAFQCAATSPMGRSLTNDRCEVY